MIELKSKYKLSGWQSATAVLVELWNNDTYRILGFCSPESVVKSKGIFLYKKGFKTPSLHPGGKETYEI
jgi:hypothetical protein